MQGHDRCEAAWLAAYALGLATADRDEREAIADLGSYASDPDLCCEAIDRLASCTAGDTHHRQRAIDLLARASQHARARGAMALVDLREASQSA